LVLDLIFLQAELVEFNKHEISPDLWSSSYHTLLLVYIIIEEEFIQEKNNLSLEIVTKRKNLSMSSELE